MPDEDAAGEVSTVTAEWPSSKRDFLVYRAVDGALRHGLRTLPVGPATESLALWWGYRYRPAPTVTRLRSGLRMQVGSTDHLQLLIYYLGAFAPRPLRMLRKLIKPGATFVDVGANIGLFTLEGAVATGPTGRVLAIEPSPAHVAVLRQNLALNQLGNVTAVETAVGDASGEAVLVRPEGGNLGMFTLGTVKGDEAQNVSVRPLDQVLAEAGVGSVHVVKMDIEGSEYRALLGAQRVLTEDQPAILVELNGPALRGCGSSCAAVKGLLHGAGYRGWVIGHRLRPIADANSEHECDDCLFIHREKSLQDWGL